MQTLKIIGTLLSYPEPLSQGITEACKKVLRAENCLTPQAQDGIARLLTQLQNGDQLDLQEGYVDLFDRTPSLSLHLFEHVHGDSRDRGQAMVDLLALYQDSGLTIAVDELPDYLPLFLEYLSMQAPAAARAHLDSIVTIVAAIGERLRHRQSAYVALFDALIEMAARAPDTAQLDAALREASGAAIAAAELDAAWEEQFAFVNSRQTTGIDDGCPKAQAMLANIEEHIRAQEAQP